MRESGENYLETILLLQKKLGCVRSIDIANKLDYSKPSVSRAMGILKKQDYITMDKSGFIELTDKGLQKAREIYERHTLIQEFLIETLGVEPVSYTHLAMFDRKGRLYAQGNVQNG